MAKEAIYASQSNIKKVSIHLYTYYLDNNDGVKKAERERESVCVCVCECEKKREEK